MLKITLFFGLVVLGIGFGGGVRYLLEAQQNIALAVDSVEYASGVKAQGFTKAPSGGGSCGS